MHTVPLAYVSGIDGQADLVKLGDPDVVVMRTENSNLRELVPYLNKIFQAPQTFMTVVALGANGDSAEIKRGLGSLVKLNLLVKDGDAFRAATPNGRDGYLLNLRGRK